MAIKIFKLYCLAAVENFARNEQEKPDFTVQQETVKSQAKHLADISQ
ncbi:hypothetical protein [Acinetobacter sp.]